MQALVIVALVIVVIAFIITLAALGFAIWYSGNANPPNTNPPNTEPPTIQTINTEPPTIQTINTEPPTIQTINTEPMTIVTEPLTIQTINTEPNTINTINTEPNTINTINTEPLTIQTINTEPNTINTINTEPPTIVTSTAAGSYDNPLYPQAGYNYTLTAGNYITFVPDIIFYVSNQSSIEWVADTSVNLLSANPDNSMPGLQIITSSIGNTVFYYPTSNRLPELSQQVITVNNSTTITPINGALYTTNQTSLKFNYSSGTYFEIEWPNINCVLSLASVPSNVNILFAGIRLPNSPKQVAMYPDLIYIC